MAYPYVTDGSKKGFLGARQKTKGARPKQKEQSRKTKAERPKRYYWGVDC